MTFFFTIVTMASWCFISSVPSPSLSANTNQQLYLFFCLSKSKFSITKSSISSKFIHGVFIFLIWSTSRIVWSQKENMCIVRNIIIKVIERMLSYKLFETNKILIQEREESQNYEIWPIKNWLTIHSIPKFKNSLTTARMTIYNFD
jgi:hypothetical protein